MLLFDTLPMILRHADFSRRCCRHTALLMLSLMPPFRQLRCLYATPFSLFAVILPCRHLRYFAATPFRLFSFRHDAIFAIDFRAAAAFLSFRRCSIADFFAMLAIDADDAAFRLPCLSMHYTFSLMFRLSCFSFARFDAADFLRFLSSYAAPPPFSLRRFLHLMASPLIFSSLFSFIFFTLFR